MCRPAAASELHEAPPPLASSGSVLWCILKKNLLLKRRAYKTTLCELFSPALFLSILVLGYSLSDVTYLDAGIYAATTLRLEPLLEAAQPLLDGTDLSQSAACAFGGGGGSSYGGGYGSGGGNASLLGGSGGNASDAPGACAGLRNVDLLSLRSSLTSLLNGPLPVLPIDVYLAIGFAVREQLGAENFRLLNEWDYYLFLSLIHI